MKNGLEALESLMTDYYEMCQDLGNNDDQYQRCNQTSERAIIEKELKTLEVFSNFEMELDASKTIDGRMAYSLIIKNERDEELTLFLGGWEKDYNLLKEWLKRL